MLSRQRDLQKLCPEDGAALLSWFGLPTVCCQKTSPGRWASFGHLFGLLCWSNSLSRRHLMFFADRRSFMNRPNNSGRAPRSPSLRCEELEPRLQLSVTPFFFSTGSPDARVGSRSEPGNVHN